MGFYLSKFVSEWILPPGGLILLFIAAILLMRRQHRWGSRLVILGSTGLILLSLPVVPMVLMSIVEPYPAIKTTALGNHQAQAIVVLGGGRNYDAVEYGGDTVSEFTLERLRYGVFVHQHTKLPILVTGGSPLEDRVPEGHLMRDALTQSFKLQPRWVEDRSVNTAENASFSYEILKAEGIEHIYLVTHAWHMYRAVAMFEAQGFHVTPAPTAFEGFSGKPLLFFDFVPNAKALLKSYYALHEILGFLWYLVRY